jgi:hypothetical protein
MAELEQSESGCCAPDVQAACCEPTEKQDCCAPESETCGCSVGGAATGVRDQVLARYTAAAVAIAVLPRPEIDAFRASTSLGGRLSFQRRVRVTRSSPMSASSRSSKRLAVASRVAHP